MLEVWSERLAKGPYQKNTLRIVRLAPAILRMHISKLSTHNSEERSNH